MGTGNMGGGIGRNGLCGTVVQAIEGGKVYSAPGTFQVPSGRTLLFVTGVGRGQAGSIGGAFPSPGSGAGGVGGIAVGANLAVTPGETLTIVLTTHAELKRGATVIFRAPAGGSGAAIIPVVAGSTPTTGGAGGGIAGGGGGGAGGYSGFNGSNASGQFGGDGGSQAEWSGDGAGGNGGDFETAGQPGLNYGGGGGGGGSSLAGATPPGGAGGPPVLSVHWIL